MGSSDRRPYLSATEITQDLLNQCQDNLTCQLEMIAEIETPDGWIYASDRNKYVGNKFYAALLNFPVIERTIGDWLASELEFSVLTLELSNVDGRFNKYLPEGAVFESWIGKKVIVKLGLAEIESSYIKIFSGQITDAGGFRRSIKSITVVARDNYDALNVQIPKETFTRTSYPKLEAEKIDTVKPIIYGDWTVNVTGDCASVPAIVVNGADPLVDYEVSRAVEFTLGTPGVVVLRSHFFEPGDAIQFETDGVMPSQLTSETKYFVKDVTTDSFTVAATLGDTALTFSGPVSGNSRVTAFQETPTPRNVKLVISSDILTYFDPTHVYLRKSDNFYRIDQADIVNIEPQLNAFEIRQNAVTTVEGKKFMFSSGDAIFVRVKGKNLSGYNDNIVAQARDLLVRYTTLQVDNFHTSWEDLKLKSGPDESAILNFKSRIWLQEPTSLLQYVLSLLEQVRVEMFINRELELELSPLHFDEFIPNPSHTITNRDIEKDSFVARVDDKTNINRLRGIYGYLPDKGEEGFALPIWKNPAAIAQVGKEISKQIVFPNLYRSQDVEPQVKEILKISSAYMEIYEFNLTWRSALLDISQFVKLEVEIGSLKLSGVPALVRKIGYDPRGFKLVVSCWSFQMCPFDGYSPGGLTGLPGTVGGKNAILAQE